MPIDWEPFLKLPGASDVNFEKLCRVLVRRQYGQYGHFAALPAQPGVEFHLKVNSQCALGGSDRWFGWQCRWYDLPSGRAIGTTRRNKILDAIAKTAAELPQLTDWVLWTKNALSRGDQQWYHQIRPKMRLHLWTEDEVQEHLGGNGQLAKETFFGELILTPETLSALREKAIAPVRSRWLPEAHQPVDAERWIRRSLGEPTAWNDLLALAKRLKDEADEAELLVKDLEDQFGTKSQDAIRFARWVALTVANAHKALVAGDRDLLIQQLENRQTKIAAEIKAFPRWLRAVKHRASLYVTNMLASAESGDRFLKELLSVIDIRYAVVLADAGCGKTQLSAQLTAESADRPAGIFIQGRDLLSRNSLNQLAGHIAPRGRPISTLEGLLAAVDSAGQRAGRRLPIIVDGLNESEDPRDWKVLLPSLQETLKEYPYVLFVCTLRSTFDEICLPSGGQRLPVASFEEDTSQAVQRYFAYFKINATDADIPYELLRHPLTLRLFCEVANQSRENEVGVEALPLSLTGLFERYLDQVAERVASLASARMPYEQQDVRKALDEIGWTFWEEKSRSLEVNRLRARLNDAGRLWSQSIVNALEQDGILFRDLGKEDHQPHISGAYDMLAGHLIAKAILGRLGSVGFEAWIKESTTIESLVGRNGQAHPLAEDIFDGFVGLIPRKFYRGQLWQLLKEPLRSYALDEAANLEAPYLDTDTIKEIHSRGSQSTKTFQHLLVRLWQTRGIVNHGLNVDFLDSILRPMKVAERDLCWTEWLRDGFEAHRRDFRKRETHWRAEPFRRIPSDYLRAKWIMWTLTTTSRDLRDHATRALYWYGRGTLEGLFSLTIDSLSINDTYVSERTIAASYGVVMANQVPSMEFTTAFGTFLSQLGSALVGAAASHPTNDWLIRMYVQGMARFASKFCPQCLPPAFPVKLLLLRALNSSLSRKTIPVLRRFKVQCGWISRIILLDAFVRIEAITTWGTRRM